MNVIMRQTDSEWHEARQEDYSNRNEFSVVDSFDCDFYCATSCALTPIKHWYCKYSGNPQRLYCGRLLGSSDCALNFVLVLFIFTYQVLCELPTLCYWSCNMALNSRFQSCQKTNKIRDNTFFKWRRTISFNTFHKISKVQNYVYV